MNIGMVSFPLSFSLSFCIIFYISLPPSLPLLFTLLSRKALFFLLSLAILFSYCTQFGSIESQRDPMMASLSFQPDLFTLVLFRLSLLFVFNPFLLYYIFIIVYLFIWSFWSISLPLSLTWLNLCVLLLPYIISISSSLHFYVCSSLFSLSLSRSLIHPTFSIWALLGRPSLLSLCLSLSLHFVPTQRSCSFHLQLPCKLQNMLEQNWWSFSQIYIYNG